MSSPVRNRAPRHPAAALLTDLFHHRWGLSVLAALSAGSHLGRVAALAGHLGTTRATLRRTLAGLGERGLTAPNPGHGHPLRPEYLPTPRGQALAPWCVAVLAALEREGAQETAAKKWAMPALYVVARGEERFTRIEAGLAGITARALTLALKDLTEAGLIVREVFDDFPPSVRYRATPRGRRLARLLSRVAEADGA